MRHDITAAQNLLDRDLTTPWPENVGHAVSRWSSLARHTTRYPLKIWFLIDSHNYDVVVKKVELDVPQTLPTRPPALRVAKAPRLPIPRRAPLTVSCR